MKFLEKKRSSDNFCGSSIVKQTSVLLSSCTKRACLFGTDLSQKLSENQKFISKMMKHVSFSLFRFLCICLCIGALSNKTTIAQTLPQVVQGKITRYANFSSKFVTERHIDVWTPANYNPQKKYAVLYMNDGQMLFDGKTTWNGQEWGLDEAMHKLISSNKIEECIVVGIWNTGKTRHIEYFPQKPFERLPQTFRDSILQNLKRDEDTPLFAGKVQSDNYLKFIVEELKPFIDST